MTKKPLPFKLDRASSDSFRRQLVEGVREAIRAGYYKAGDVLPSLGETVAALKVSDIVVRGAYRTLAAEGLIVSRKGYGSVVHPPKTPIWRGRVLCVSTDFDFSLLQCATVERLRAHCLRNGEESPIDVYDAAAWMSITALSEASVAAGGMPQSVPDFTNGKWTRRAPRDVTQI